MKSFYSLIILFFLLAPLFADNPLYLDPNQEIDVRINDLLSRMTLEEKVSQMANTSPAIPHLNIQEYEWWNEALHGVARSGIATVFPQSIAMGATFNPELIERVATAVSDEARVLHHAAARRDIRLRYGGLTFWAPNINIYRDPRWGRGMETYGEDPFLTGLIGTAYVKGLQGDHPRYLKTAAGAKHYAVHSGPEHGRREFNAIASTKDLYETYLPAFKTLVDAGVEAIMCAYNSTNGEPCCAHNYLINEVLRDKWGFKGHVVTDCWSLNDFFTSINVAEDAVEAAALALINGVDLECGSVYNPNLVTAVERGLITEDQIDVALSRLLSTRFRLGMFDPEEINPYANIPDTVLNSSTHRALSREVAVESMVLLKNNGILPLRDDLSRYFVTGPNASSIHALIGNYYGVNDRYVTILEGIAGRVQIGSQVQYRPAILLDRPNVNPIDWSTGSASVSDVTILVLGITNLLEGEEGEAIASPYYGDRLDYSIPENQLDYLRRLTRNENNKIVAVIVGGSPMNLKEVHELADAVLLVWYPGQEGGNAVADVLFGDAAPGGRLPVTYPMSLDQLPPYEDYSMEGRTYRYMKESPMYPFGYGLSYTSFEYSDISLADRRIRRDGKTTVRATVTNIGNMAASEVVQLYITNPPSRVTRTPLFSLRGFEKIFLEPGESREVVFEIDKDMLVLIDDYGKETIDAGDYTIAIGGALPTERSVELGMPVPVRTTLNVR
ncbi:glycoside hydrolase family 3 N-terminal domain-containing protein [Natronoflexus pectinivorans]|uniref:Beta-glucosidase n=1 Tax=Natronoflexus pectinivorans TaxID=682526 RepID=A0A4R2GFM7_9BACT|nr:glycoside hydrolase family 3 N-terminal domain-containing protein [Natronoflexus pectinivorans]TCO06099.1 beta-glucosidase [Natronoflexus pectinivorans]